MAIPCQVRIQRDKHSQDGYIGRMATGRVAFIHNIGERIRELEAGQIWEAKIHKECDRYCLVELDKLA